MHLPFFLLRATQILQLTQYTLQYIALSDSIFSLTDLFSLRSLGEIFPFYQLKIWNPLILRIPDMLQCYVMQAVLMFQLSRR